MPEHHQPKLYAFVAIIVVALCLVLGFVYLTDVDGDVIIENLYIFRED